MELDDDALRLLAEEARFAAIATGAHGDPPGVEAYLDTLVERTLAHAAREAAVRAMEGHARHVVMEARRQRVDRGFFR